MVFSCILSLALCTCHLEFRLRQTTHITSGRLPPPTLTTPSQPIMNNFNPSGSTFGNGAQWGTPQQDFTASTTTTTPNNVGGLSSSQYATPSNEKVQRFNNWHNKQGIATPQDYQNYASQPDPFSTLPGTPLRPTAASPYLQKVGGLPGGRPADSLVSRTLPPARKSCTWRIFCQLLLGIEWKRR